MKEHKSVFLSWKSPKNNSWHVVGLLRENNINGSYTFNYTNGAIEALETNNFMAFNGMEDIYSTYRSDELFPLFKNRLLSPKRPEYPRFISWLGLDEDEISPIDIFRRSGGTRETDQFQLFSRVEFDKSGYFEHIFFAHSLSHLGGKANERVSTLNHNDRLYLCLDSQNSFDRNAVIIRAENPAEIIGYCPRFLANDISSFIKKDKNSIEAYVESVGQDSPSNYKLMCKIKGKADKTQISDFMKKEEFQILDNNMKELMAN